MGYFDDSDCNMLIIFFPFFLPWKKESILLEGDGSIWRLSRYFYRRSQCLWLPVCLLVHGPTLIKKSFPKGKKIYPSSSKFFPFGVDHKWQGWQTQYWQSYLPCGCIHFTKVPYKLHETNDALSNWAEMSIDKSTNKIHT